MVRAVRVTGGPIFTGARYVEALLLEDGVVRAAGSEASVRRDAPTGAEHVELHGRLAIPGLIDPHLHIPELTQVREGLDLGDASSTDVLLERFRAWATARPVGPLVGRGWSPDRTADGRWLTARDLDGVVPDRPALLYHASGHMAVVNRATLDALGVDARSADPPGGRWGRGADGVPNGQVYEGGLKLLGPLAAAAHPPDPDAYARTLTAAAGLGLTTVATLNLHPHELAALRALASRNALPIRVRAYVRLARFRDFTEAMLAPVPATDRWRVIGGKAFTDGAFGPRTAWLSQPYRDAPGESGMPVAAEGELAEAVAWTADRGLAPALHAIGDRAVGRAARLLEPYRTEEGPRPRIEHASLVPPEILPDLERSRPALVVQPGFVLSDHWLADRLGAERARWAYPFRTLTERGYLLAGSSDAPYDPVDPWRGLGAAVHRVDADGRSANPAREETLSPEEALRLYGRNAGEVLGEPSLGTLEPGAPADLVLVRAGTAEGALADGAAGLLETWVAGERIAVGPGASGGTNR